MSGETEDRPSAWTIDSLKELTETRLSAHENLSLERDRRYQERFEAQEHATAYAQEKANEFRGALDDLSTKQATKLELTTMNKTLSDKIDVQANLIGDLRSRIDGSSGIAQGSQLTMGKIYAAIGGVGAIIAIIVLLSNHVLH